VAGPISAGGGAERKLGTRSRSSAPQRARKWGGPSGPQAELLLDLAASEK